MSYTTHGFHILGTDWIAPGKHIAVTNCGGPVHCDPCSEEAKVELVSSEAQLIALMHEGLPKALVDFTIARMKKKGYEFDIL